MCQKCEDAVKQYFPILSTNKDRCDFLMGYTSFPFDDGDAISQQLKELFIKSNGDIAVAVKIYENEFDVEMRRISEIRKLVL